MSHIDEMRAITDAATPGPWRRSKDYGRVGGAPVVWHTVEADDMVLVADMKDGGPPDAEFIAMARNAFLAMLDALEAAEKLASLYKTAEFKELQDYLARVRDLWKANDDG